MWNDETMQCRGLILDGYGNVAARPFRKFFNLEEHREKPDLPVMPEGSFEVYEKFDGSLGILYWIGDEPRLATRGSFMSEQAAKGTEILRQYGTDVLSLDRSKTYLFEIIYPENRIVVDYGKREDLFLLAVIDTATGREESLSDYCGPFPFAAAIPDLEALDQVLALKDESRENFEGYVVKWANGFRVKVKMDEYVRLHRLITGVNERRIWDVLRNGESLDGLLERVPDEFFRWVQNTTAKLKESFSAYEEQARNAYLLAGKMPTRKEQAAWLQDSDPVVRSCAFAMLDGKPYEHIIWKNIKPNAERPFKIEI
jgi:hypothetical protein